MLISQFDVTVSVSEKSYLILVISNGDASATTRKPLSIYKLQLHVQNISKLTLASVVQPVFVSLICLAITFMLVTLSTADNTNNFHRAKFSPR